MLKLNSKLNNAKSFIEQAPPSFLQFCSTRKIDFEEPMDSIQILKNITGFSRYEQGFIKELDDKYLQEEFIEQQKNIFGISKYDVEYASVFYDSLEEIKILLEKGDINFDEAYKRFNKAKAQIKEYFQSLKKPKKERKPKVKEEEPEEDGLDVDKLLELVKLEKPMHFISIGKTRDSDYGFIMNDKMPTGMALTQGKKLYEININELAKLLEV
jgi:exonuclease VII small subunit